MILHFAIDCNCSSLCSCLVSMVYAIMVPLLGDMGYYELSQQGVVWFFFQYHVCIPIPIPLTSQKSLAI
jgi:hypothetical protein